MSLLQYQQGRVNLTARWLWAGDDLFVLITGGDAPHIGALCLAGPESGAQAASYPGHRENQLAREMALHLSAKLERKVVVAAGMHWDEFSPQLLREIENAWQEIARRLLNCLREDLP